MKLVTTNSYDEILATLEEVRDKYASAAEV
jgi:hypothetical protein